MSDRDLRAAIEQMEAWLSDLNWEPEVEAVVLWNARLREAIALAEKGSDWPELVGLAHGVGQRLELRIQQFVQRQAGIRARLDEQGQGNRALKGYKASAR